MHDPVVYRNHFSYLISKSVGVLAVLLVLIFRDPEVLKEIVQALRSSEVSIPPSYYPYIGGGMILFIGYIYLAIRRWRKTYIILDDTNLVVHRATMVDKKNTIALSTVSSVNFEQTIFQMILGVYRIRIDTNTATTADTTDVELVLAKAKAEAFKARVMGTMGSEHNGARSEADGEPIVHTATTREVLVHAVVSMEMASLLVGIGTLILGIGSMVEELRDLSAASIGNLAYSVLILLIAAWSLIGTPAKRFFHLYDFYCERSGDTLHLKYGLTRTRDFRVPVSKIHAVVVRQSLFARCLGYEEVQVKVIGMGDDEEEIRNVVLCGPKAKTEERLRTLLPEFYPFYVSAWERVHNRVIAVRTAVRLVVPILVLTIAAIFIPGARVWKVVTAAATLAVVILMSVLGGRTAGLAVMENGLMVRSGIFTAERTLVTYRELQTVKLSAGPILRRLGVMEGTLTCFGGILDAVISVNAFPKKMMEKIADRIRRG